MAAGRRILTFIMSSVTKITCLLILFYSFLISQTNKCNYCKEEIKGKYLQADGKKYHPNHFICDHCKKPINSSYVDNDDKVYHQHCYNEIAYDKCDVCNDPLIGSYIIDSHNYKYHQKHEREYKICDICGRLITNKISSGGVILNDGRNQCNICKKESFKSVKLYQSYLSGTISKLSTIGIKIDRNKVSIKSVDRNELKDAAGSIYSKNMKGFCNSSLKKDAKGRIVSSKHIIYVLNNMPPEYTESIIAHELFHTWIRENTNIKHTDQLEEGSCNFISYQIMKKRNNYNSRVILKNYENDPSHIYGDGFRKVKNKFNGKYIVELLNYLKRFDSI